MRFHPHLQLGHRPPNNSLARIAEKLQITFIDIKQPSFVNRDDAHRRRIRPEGLGKSFLAFLQGGQRPGSPARPQRGDPRVAGDEDQGQREPGHKRLRSPRFRPADEETGRAQRLESLTNGAAAASTSQQPLRRRRFRRVPAANPHAPKSPHSSASLYPANTAGRRKQGCLHFHKPHDSGSSSHGTHAAIGADAQ